MLSAQNVCINLKFRRKDKIDGQKDDLAGNGRQRHKLTFYDRHAANRTNKNELRNETFEFFQSYRDVLSSKVYVSSVIGRVSFVYLDNILIHFIQVMDVLAFKGYIIFLPKFLENHYGIAQHKVHILIALFGVFGFALGCVFIKLSGLVKLSGFIKLSGPIKMFRSITGGLVMRLFKLNGRQAAVFLLFASAINAGTFVAKSLFGCHSTVNSIGLAGVPTNFNYTNACNNECSCQNSRLFPVCDVTRKPYYSPCHAGCRHVTVLDVKLVGSINVIELVSFDSRHSLNVSVQKVEWSRVTTALTIVKSRLFSSSCL